MILGVVKGQELSLSAPVMAGESVDYLTAEFQFSADWAGVEKFVIFGKQGETPYQFHLKDDEISEKDHLNLKDGIYSVCVLGEKLKDGNVEQRITTVPVSILIEKSCIKGEPIPIEPPSLGEQILAEAQRAVKIAQSVRDDADAGKLNGKDGFSPVANVKKVGKVATISITDKVGSTSAEIRDGENGKDGKDGKNGENGKDGDDRVYVGADPVPPNTIVHINPNGVLIGIPDRTSDLINDSGFITEKDLFINAPAIRETAQGEVVNIQDSSENPFFNLAVCGKTTQNGIPTPDAPVPLETIGADGSVEVVASNKNLIPESEITKRIGTKNIYAWSKQYIPSTKGYLLKAGVPYTFSCSKTCSEIAIKPFDDGTKLKYGYNVKSINYTPDKDVRIYLDTYFADNTVKEEDYIQLEIGDTATEIVPNKQQSITLPTPNGLNGIKVDKDGNYIDSTGQQWICDSIEKTEQGWAVVKRCNKIIIGKDGFKDTYESVNLGAVYRKGVLIATPETYTNEAKSYAFACLSNGFAYKATYTGNNPHIYCDKAVCFIFVSTENWLELNNTDLIYCLATPIITPITNPELTAQLDLLHTYYGVTTITATDNAGLKADYSADTKIYIDSKFTELQNAILSTGGNI